MENRITVKLPVDSLLFWKLSGREALSESFALTLTVLGTDDQVESSQLLGQAATITILTQGATRYINGKVTRMVTSATELSGTRYAVYQLTLEPDLWPMKRDRNLRIFQGQTAPQIVKTLLSEYQVNVEDKLFGSYRIWDYCVQYQESSFDFISRLMELEGIAYHFRHEADRHLLVLTDAATEHQPFSGYEHIPYQQTASGGTTNEEGIAQWTRENSVTPGIYSLDDYDFRKPYAWLFQARQNPASPQPGSIDVYDWPGRFVEHGHGEYYARIRQERWQVEHQQIQGTTTAVGVAPGHTFTLYNAPFPRDNGEYLILEVNYFLEENRYASGSETEAEQRIDFSVIPSSVLFRPAAITAWPKTYGPQTAKVVGPQGETIWTDKYGRVKVQFHWDREAKGDDTSSCWVRVSSAWAGQGCGGVQIPRVGDEVVIDFINGEPDRPIVTGRVYNDANMPPRALPAAATQMGFMTRSKGGNKDNASYLFFEDRAGSEAVDLHSEKDMNVSAENDQTVNVAGKRTIIVAKQLSEDVTGDAFYHYHARRTTTVEGLESTTFNNGLAETIKFGRKLDIESGGESMVIKGDRNIQVKGPQTHHITGHVKEKFESGLKSNISSGGKWENIHGGLTVNVNSGNWEQIIKAGTIHLTSPNMIKLTSLEQIVLDAPEAVFKPKFHSLSVTALSESFVGHSASSTGASSGVTGVALSSQGTAIGVRIHEISQTMYKQEENGIVVNFEETHITNQSLQIVNNILCIFA